jgi:hypothetical protein
MLLEEKAAVLVAYSTRGRLWVIRDWGETAADEAISAAPRLRPKFAMQSKS